MAGSEERNRNTRLRAIREHGATCEREMSEQRPGMLSGVGCTSTVADYQVMEHVHASR